MTGVIWLTHWVIFRIKHPRILVPPTQFQKMSKNFKIEFPRNRTKILLSPESAWFTELVQIFWNKKSLKLQDFFIPEFNLDMEEMEDLKIQNEELKDRLKKNESIICELEERLSKVEVNGVIPPKRNGIIESSVLEIVNAMAQVSYRTSLKLP